MIVGPDDTPADRPQAIERRAAAIAEAAVVVALGLAAIWLIRAQTTHEAVLGLPPAFLPTVCAVAIIALALVGLTVRLWRPEALPAEPPLPFRPALTVLGLAIVGALVLQLAEGSSFAAFASGLVVIVPGLALLGERRLPVLIGTTGGAALVLAVVYQVWR